MSRRLIFVSGAVALLVIVAGVGIGWQVSGKTDPPDPPVEPTVPSEAYTPGEVTAEVTVMPDGTLTVEETIVFDALDGSREPLRRVVGRLDLGYHPGGDGRVYADPAYSKPSGAVELVRNKDPIPLRVGTGTPEYAVDEDAPGTEWRATHPDGRWTPGRHAIRFSYTVEDVHVEYDGFEAVVVPLPQGGLIDAHVDLVSMTVRSAGPGFGDFGAPDAQANAGSGIEAAICQATNYDFRSAGQECGNLTKDGYELTLGYGQWVDGVGSDEHAGGFHVGSSTDISFPAQDAVVLDVSGLTGTPIPVGEETTE